MTLVVVVALDGHEDEHQRQRAEDERLDEGQDDLEAVQRDRRQEAGREAQHDGQRHLAPEDVAEESRRERDGLDELEHELHEPHEDGDEAGADAAAELAEGKELGEVAACPEAPDTLDVEGEEGHQRQADGHVEVAGGGAQPVKVADGWHESAPVEDEDEHEEGREERQVASRLGAAHAQPEAADGFVGPLQEVLHAARHVGPAACRPGAQHEHEDRQQGRPIVGRIGQAHLCRMRPARRLLAAGHPEILVRTREVQGALDEADGVGTGFTGLLLVDGGRDDESREVDHDEQHDQEAQRSQREAATLGLPVSRSPCSSGRRSSPAGCFFSHSRRDCDQLIQRKVSMASMNRH